jgi:hypothetical protein
LSRKRKEFTDQQKAQIYARDRATCAFSGKSLWILDYGVSPTFEIDWVDHIKPASRGGGNSIDNGVCASYFYNSKKGANTNDNKYLFLAGRPTEYFFYFYEVLPESVANHLCCFANLQESDWYFNRALSRFMCGLGRLDSLRDGVSYVRDENYYAKSAAKMLKKWRGLAADSETFVQRGLVGRKPSHDQKALLSLQLCDGEADVLEMMHQCKHWYFANVDVMEMLIEAESTAELEKIAAGVKQDKSITNRVQVLVLENIQRLSLLADK